MRARVQPGNPAAQHFNRQLTLLHIDPIDVRDLQFSAWRRLQIGRYIQNLIVVKVESCDGVSRLGLLRLFFQTHVTARGIQLDHPVALRNFHLIREDRRS